MALLQVVSLSENSRYLPPAEGIERLLIELTSRDQPFGILEPAECLTGLRS
jgi:hypothetical protein